MSLSLAAQDVHHDLRTKKLYLIATPTGNYVGPATTAIGTGAFTQPGGAGKPLQVTLAVPSTLSGSVTFSTSGGTGSGTQAVNMATYTGLGSPVPATATAAAVALALALTSGALGAASGSTYTGSISNGVLSIATSKSAEVLSVTVSSLSQVTPGGDTLNLGAITNTLGQADANIGYPGIIKNFGVVSGPAGYPPPLIIPGTTLNNWLLRVFSAIDTELASGAYPTDILAGTYILVFEGPKLRM